MTTGHLCWPGPREKNASAELVFFTGRIDNADELAAACNLSVPVQPEKLLVPLYERFRAKSADMIIGDFVIALWDPHQRAVVCMRDVSGCGTAYYTYSDTEFRIADTIEALTRASGLAPELDLPFVRRALSNPFNHPERNLLRSIYKVPPAHIATITANGRKIERYWDPRKIAPMDYSDPAAAQSRFRAIFMQAVRDRMPPEARIGVHLSGGLDCSSIAIAASAIARDAGRAPPTAFAWQPPPDGKTTLDAESDQTWAEVSPDEYALLDCASAAAGLPVVYCPLTKDDCLQVWDRDDTLCRATGALYSEWPVLRRAEEMEIGVILSGLGGDEAASFNGRGYLPGLALRLRWRTLYRFARARGENGLKAILSGLREGLYALVLPDAVLHSLTREIPYGVPKWKTTLRAVLRRSESDFLLSREQAKELAHAVPYFKRSAFHGVTPLPNWPEVRKTSARRAMRMSFERGHLSERIEGWAAEGARRGIRFAYPLLDKRVLEFIFALPENVFQTPKAHRSFFRQAMAPILPDLILQTPKGTEEARAGAAMRAGKDALIAYGQLMSQGRITSPRLAYLDREQLLQALSPEAIESRQGVARLLLAAQFVGLGTK